MNNKHQALPEHELLAHKSFIQNLNLFDWAFALLIAIGAFIAQTRAGPHMDIYEIAILWTSTGIAVFLGWFFKPMRWSIPVGVCLAYSAVDLYGGDIKRAGGFLLKYLLNSQSAIIWQCTFVFFALFTYIIGAIAAVRRNVPTSTLLGVRSMLAWVSAMAGFVDLLVRWHESYLLRPGAGHIPTPNLYEVFILFLATTALMYFYYEGRSAVQKLDGLVLSFMTIIVRFVSWYSVSHETHTIQPLVPALQSWWMKVHVPTNFIGYGAFCITTMLGVAGLLALRREDAGKKSWLP